MPMEGSGYNRGRSVSGPHTYSGKYPAQNERFGIYGISERKEFSANISKMGNMKFAYRNREFWCRGYYVDAASKNTKAIK